MRSPRKRTRRRAPVQRELFFHGGRRKGAGRPCGKKPIVLHRKRSPLDPRKPVHVTFRFAVGGLRRDAVNDAVRQVLASLLTRRSFRVLAYSLQGNHLHVIVEGDSAAALRSGLYALPIRLARRINAALGRRGRLFAERHHRQPLGTPSEVRNAFAYVLLNRRKHLAQLTGNAGPDVLDPMSSAGWFAGWDRPVIGDASLPLVASPQTWLANVGWLRRGRIDPAEIPGPRTRPVRRKPSR